ncbi:MAG: protein kinase [Chloroflexota bacterium]
MIGNRLGPYEILEEVGRGGMATVYRARQPRVERDVAVKVIRKSIADNEQAVQRFQREARLIARLEHPHILPVYDFDGGYDPPYIVMRYLEGGTLKEVLQQRQLPAPEVLFLLNQVASALDYAHRQGIIHRDVKPSNIMIDRDGNAIVSDFGIARIVVEESTITGSGEAVGTPDYMSPEQARGLRDVDQRTDIYSLGIMAFQMLAGQLPYTADSPVGILIQHIQQPVPDVRHFNPDLPEAVGPVLKQAMAKNPQERYETAGNFVFELNTALGSRVTQSPLVLREAVLRAWTARQDEARHADQGHISTGSQAVHAEQNKPVTALYANASEYIEVVEQLSDTEVARQAMNVFWDSAAQHIGERGGKLLERTDRDLLAVWGAEVAGEEDAERAVFAALDIQAVLRQQGEAFLAGELGQEDALPLKIGVNTGLALLVRDESTGTLTASGATISLAQRLAESANGMILIAHDTFREVQGVFSIAPHETLKLRGRKEPLAVYRVQSAKARAFRIKVRGVEGVQTSLVGREAELKQIQHAYLDAVEEHETQLVTIIGEAGLGKTRLLYEFSQWAELYPVRYRVFRGRATFAMNSRPYALLRDLISFRFEILDTDAPVIVSQKLERGVAELVGEDVEMAHLIGYLCGFDLSASPYVSGLRDDPQQLSQRARQLALRLFTRLGKIQPIVLGLEDVHFADDASLDLLLELVCAYENLPLLLIVLARPSLLERYPDWGKELRFHRLISLSALDRREGRELVQQILQMVGEVPRELRDLIVERGEGNPFYIEELIKMLIEDRVILKESPELWRVEVSRLEHLRVPPTLVGVLQARFDSLLYPEKVALQRAAVIGRVFYNQAIAALDEVDEVRLEGVDGVLERLEERELVIRRDASAFEGSVEYLFAQNMLRDLIYETLLARRKTAYHAGAAAWLSHAAGGRADEYAPLVAEHYELAGQPHMAAVFLAQAGKRALALSAFAEARHLLERSLSLLPKSAGSERLEGGLALADVLIKVADFEQATQILDQTLQNARESDQVGVQAQALYHLSQIDTQRGDWQAARHRLGEALPLARQAAQGEALAWTLYGLADTHYRSGGLKQARSYAEEALEFSRQSGNRAVERAALNRLATILWVSDGQDQEQLARAMRLLEEVHNLAQMAGDRRMALTALANLGAIQREHGNRQASLNSSRQALALAHEIGNTMGVIVVSLNLAIEHCLDGEPEKARSLASEALRLACSIDSETWQAAGVVCLGAIRLAEGDLGGGLALLGLARSHPAAGGDELKDIQYVLDGLLGEKLKNGVLSQTEIEAGMAVGEGMDLPAVVEQFLNHG